jgi:hypothetical protein
MITYITYRVKRQAENAGIICVQVEKIAGKSQVVK